MSYAVRARAVRRQVASALRESERNARKAHKDAILTMRAEARETVILALESVKKDARRKKEEAAAEKRRKANARKAGGKAAVPRARKRESAKNQTPTPTPTPTPDLCTVWLPGFAEIVTAAAKSEKAVTWHGDRAFISTVWSAIDPRVRMRCSLEQFKERLLDAHKQRLVRLTRADLVRAMSDSLVRESETHSGQASYHFIALD